ncbi:MAG TPA: hypothetical protein VH309_11270 [Elusimicrobiota bacterium]|nr:hypothetical protein [Elusimicrobiota bacterium]
MFPAPDYWQPKYPGCQLKLSLSPEKSTLRSGEKLRYRLELQNVGGKDCEFSENPSFIKLGENALSSQYKFILTAPDGAASEILPPMPSFGSLPPPAKYHFSKMTDAEADAAMKKMDSEKEARDFLFLRLHPGETFATRPDSPAPDIFRTSLATTARDFGSRLVMVDGLMPVKTPG